MVDPSSTMADASRNRPFGVKQALAGTEDLSVIDVRVVTTPIPEVLTYFRSPRHNLPESYS